MARALKLFEPQVPPEKMGRVFKTLLDLHVSPTRDELEEAYSRFTDVDGDFVTKFQTDALDARLFELFLFVLFEELGFERDVTHQRPDFVLSREGFSLCVEAVTANPPQDASRTAPPADEGFEEMVTRILKAASEKQQAILAGEVRNRLGRPMLSKLKKKYWNLPHVAERPLVIAAQDFHGEGSLLLLGQPLGDFLYPDFFRRAGAEHVSAVMFVNSATASKFGRMRLQRATKAYPTVLMHRVGWYYPATVEGTSLALFNYWVGDPAWPESWLQGVTLFHNPDALQPLDRSVFRGAKQYLWDHGQLEIELPAFHPEASTTATTMGV
jgi:hypothetical protein